MGFFDNMLGRREEKDPNEEIINSLASLDSELSGAFRTYLVNKSKLHVLSKEAVEQFQMVKGKDKNEQTRELEPYLRESLALMENQRRLLTGMRDCSKKRRFRMAKDLSVAVTSVTRTEDTLRRVVAANNDPTINRLQGMNDALTNHKSMELGVLWPVLR